MLVGMWKVKMVIVMVSVRVMLLVMWFLRWNIVRVRKKNMIGMMVVVVDRLRLFRGV